MWKIYFQDTVYGTVSLVDGVMVIDGDRQAALAQIVEHYRGDGESDAELVAGIDQRLHGHWFAVPIDQE